MNLLLVFGFSLLTLGYFFPTRKNPTTVQIPEHDKELIRELKRYFDKAEDSFYQETNATVIAVYRAIVDHKIADENTLKSAQDCLNEWNQSPRKFPNISHFKKMVDIMDSVGDEQIRLWNRWTSGSCSKILINMARTMAERERLWTTMIRDTANQLSDSMKTFKSSLFECVHADADDFTCLSCANFNTIVIPYI